LAKHALFTVANLVLNLFKFEICSTLSPVCTNILPAAHAVTGCDTTSLLFGIGKWSVFKVLKENPDNFKDLLNLADCDVDVSVAKSGVTL
jgi:hypothetical protein